MIVPVDSSFQLLDIVLVVYHLLIVRPTGSKNFLLFHVLARVVSLSGIPVLVEVVKIQTGFKYVELSFIQFGSVSKFLEKLIHALDSVVLTLLDLKGSAVGRSLSGYLMRVHNALLNRWHQIVLHLILLLLRLELGLRLQKLVVGIGTHQEGVREILAEIVIILLLNDDWVFLARFLHLIRLLK